MFSVWGPEYIPRATTEDRVSGTHGMEPGDQLVGQGSTGRKNMRRRIKLRKVKKH